jgi:hypothetical protein
MITLPTAQFLQNVKALQKKNPSVMADLKEFRAALLEDPQQGESLGKNVIKCALALAQKKRANAMTHASSRVLKSRMRQFIYSQLTKKANGRP